MLGHVAARPFFFDDALNARAAPSTSAVALLRIAPLLCSGSIYKLGYYQGIRLVW